MHAGYDSGKKVKGIKRHLLVDTLGLMINIAVSPADVQDRDGLPLVLDRQTRHLHPFIDVIFADQGYQGPKAAEAVARTGTWKLEIVQRPPDTKGFVVLPKRWIVERTFSWVTRCRRLARDVEGLTTTAVTIVRLAMIKLMVRRLARQ